MVRVRAGYWRLCCLDKFERHDAQLCAMAARDKQMVLAWRNQDRVRQHMYTTHVISEAEHDTWFGNVLVRQDQCGCGLTRIVLVGAFEQLERPRVVAVLDGNLGEAQ